MPGVSSKEFKAFLKRFGDAKLKTNQEMYEISSRTLMEKYLQLTGVTYLGPDFSICDQDDTHEKQTRSVTMGPLCTSFPFRLYAADGTRHDIVIPRIFVNEINGMMPKVIMSRFNLRPSWNLFLRLFLALYINVLPKVKNTNELLSYMEEFDKNHFHSNEFVLPVEPGSTVAQAENGIDWSDPIICQLILNTVIATFEYDRENKFQCISYMGDYSILEGNAHVKYDAPFIVDGSSREPFVKTYRIAYPKYAREEGLAELHAREMQKGFQISFVYPTTTFVLDFLLSFPFYIDASGLDKEIFIQCRKYDRAKEICVDMIQNFMKTTSDVYATIADM